MGGMYIPNPPGTLPYKQPFGQVFGQTMQAVAATISDYYEKKRAKAQQGAQVQLQLMQAGLGGNPRDLIRSLKHGYDINITEESVRAIQAQAQVRSQLEQQQMQAQTKVAEAQAKQLEVQGKFREQWTSAVEGGNASRLARLREIGPALGMPVPELSQEQRQRLYELQAGAPVATLATTLAEKFGYDLKTAQEAARSMILGTPWPAGASVGAPSREVVDRALDITTHFQTVNGEPIPIQQAIVAVQTGNYPTSWASSTKVQSDRLFELQQSANQRAVDEFMESKKEYLESKTLREKQLEETQERTALLKQQREEVEAEHKRIAQDHVAQRLIGVYRELIKNASGDDRRKLEVELVQQLRAMGYDIDAKIVGHWGLGWLGYGRRVETTRPSTETPASKEDLDRLLK